MLYPFKYHQILRDDRFLMKNIECKNHNPMITVLMTIYRDREYLTEAIESIVNQSYKNWEFLIIAEPETPEESLKIVQSFHDKRIRLIINKKHLGFSESLNKGIRLARGKYIARMDPDDISLPHRLLFQILYMQLHPEIAVSGGNACYVNKNGKKLYKSSVPLSPRGIRVSLHFSDIMIHPSVIFRKNVFIKNRYFYRNQAAEDYELWTRVCRRENIGNIEFVLIKRRVHGDNAVLKYKNDIYEADLITQRELWEFEGIDFLLHRPWYDIRLLNKKEKQVRRRMISELYEITPFFMGKQRIFKKMFQQWDDI